MAEVYRFESLVARSLVENRRNRNIYVKKSQVAVAVVLTTMLRSKVLSNDRLFLARF